MERALLNKNGFTLVEILVAMVLFSLVLIFMLHSFLLAYRFNYTKLVKDEATKIAQNELERLRNTSYSSINTVCSGICNNFNPSTVSNQCKITHQVRNHNVVFGREIIVNENPPYKTITVIVCTVHKDKNGNNIKYQTTTIISDKGF